MRISPNGVSGMSDKQRASQSGPRHSRPAICYSRLRFGADLQARMPIGNPSFGRIDFSSGKVHLMRGLIQASLSNKPAVTVFALAIVLFGGISLFLIPVDILPVFKSPAVQVLTFYGGMPAKSMEKDITNRMERWTGQSRRHEAAGIAVDRSAPSIVRQLFHDDVDPNGALTQVNSLALGGHAQSAAGHAAAGGAPVRPDQHHARLPGGLEQHERGRESILYDVGRYEVRNMIMRTRASRRPWSSAARSGPCMIYLDRDQDAGPRTVADGRDERRRGVQRFVPAGDVEDRRHGLRPVVATRCSRPCEQMGEMPLAPSTAMRRSSRDVAPRRGTQALIQTNIVRVDGRRQVYIPVYRQQGASTLAVVEQR